MIKCEVGGCFNQPVEKAHIRSRGAGGSNKPHNIVHLCTYHHRRGDKSFHIMGIWSFAKLFGFTERFETAYDLEAGLTRTKKVKTLSRAKEKREKKPTRICPHCRRIWSKGVIKGDQYGT